MATALALTTLCFVPAQAKEARRAAPSLETLSDCHWDRPGADPFMGSVVDAIDAYADIPADVRARLKARMAKRQYDDLVSIRRDSISGRDTYGSTISDMHFGTRRMCRHVTREGWPAKAEERGLVYCEGGQCILVPTVCRNVSRITRAAVADESVDEPFEPVVAAVYPAALAPATPLPDSDTATAFAVPHDVLAGNDATFAQTSNTVVAEGTDGTSWQSAGAPGPAPGPAPTGGRGTTPPPAAVTTPVPEPETWAFMLVGAIALGARRLRLGKAAARSRR